MRLSQITLENLRRRRSRSLLLILSVFIGVTAVVFLLTTTEAMKKDVADKLDHYGSNILILPDSGEALTFGGITVEAPTQIKELDMSVLDQMQTIPNKENLGTIAPKLLADAQINGQNVLLLGVNFEQELRLKKWWKLTGISPSHPPSSNQILVGSDVARVLHLQPEQAINIKGKDFQVAGIIQTTGSLETDQAIYLDLSVLQTLTKRPQAISLVEAAALCYTCPIDEITRQLTEKLPGTKITALRATLQARDDTVNQFGLFAWSLSVILSLASALVVTLTLKASVEERTHEIGLFRAIGFRRLHIAWIILTEAGLVSLVGSVAGALAGMSLAAGFGNTLAGIQARIAWQPDVMLLAVGAALSLGLLASVYPAWKAARLDPVEALRYI